jgi:hypothetical protein
MKISKAAIEKAIEGTPPADARIGGAKAAMSL